MSQLYDASRHAQSSSAHTASCCGLANRQSITPIWDPTFTERVTFMLAWGAWQKVFGADLDFPYVVFFLLAPLAWMLLARLLWGPATRLPPGLQRLFKGKVSPPGAGRRESRPLPAA